jgi:hypothetical protein
MLRLTSLFASLALLFVSAQSETILSDNLGNALSLPLAGGNATGSITNLNSLIHTSPYVLSVYINNGENNGVSGPPVYVPGTVESYFFEQPSNGRLYGNATLVSSGYSRTFATTNLTPASPLDQYLGSPSQHINTTGLYQFTFTIPVLQSVFVQLTYINTGAPQPVVDFISILVANPAVVVGDPQFVGLRGQSYQVHGIDGAVYNIISEAQSQVNARFVFLSEGECPIINGVAEANCWSHPGSYLGEMSFQQVVDGKVHQALLTAGSAKNGFASVQVDGKSLKVGDAVSFGSFSVKMVSTHHATIETENFSFELSNSDMFINQAVSNRVPLSKLSSHGLLGQTHAAKVYPTATRYIQGEVDDYVIADNDIMGTSFAYNKFQL